MADLVSCGRRMPREIQLSARQCLENFIEAMRREECGWPLFAFESCLFCPTGMALNPIGAASMRPGRVEPAPTSGFSLKDLAPGFEIPVLWPALANLYESLEVDLVMMRRVFDEHRQDAGATKPKRLPRWWADATPAVRRAYLQGK